MVIARAPIVDRSEHVICALFSDFESARLAWKSLRERGYRPEEISIVGSRVAKKKYIGVINSPAGTKVLKGAGLGGALGMSGGALTATLLAIGAAAFVPVIGVTIAGPVVAAFLGAGAGGVFGSLLGAGIGAGIPEKRIRVVAAHLRRGGLMITVKAHSARDQALILREWKSSAEVVI